MASYPGSQTKITLTHDKESTADLKMKLITQVLSPQMQISKLQHLLSELGMGARNGSIDVTIDDGNPVTATGSVTFSNISTSLDTFTVNAVVFTAIAVTVANNQFGVAASATAQASSFAAAINASTSALVSGYITAVASTSVVTFSSVFTGLAGNTQTIAKGTDTGSVMTVSGARLTAGAAATTSNVASTYKHGV